MIKEGDIVVAFYKNGDIMVGYAKYYEPFQEYSFVVINKTFRGLIFSRDMQKKCSNIVVVDNIESNTGKKIIEPYFGDEVNPYIAETIKKALTQI